MKAMQRTGWLAVVATAWIVGCGNSNPPADTGTGNDVARVDATTMDTPSGNDVVGTDVTGNDTPAGDSSGGGCAAHTDCLSCTQDPACGYCASSHTCFEGDSSGPTGGTCAMWQYVQSDCPDYDSGPTPDVPPIDCTVATNCADCTAMDTCGWCATSGTCLTGTASGANTGVCMPAGDAAVTAWSWTSEMCPATDAGTSDVVSGG